MTNSPVAPRGIYSTAADVHALWDAFLVGRIVATATVVEMLRPRSDVATMSMRYGLGCWLDEWTDAVSLIGGDAGVGFVSTHDPDRRTTVTVLFNQSRGARPVSQRLRR